MKRSMKIGVPKEIKNHEYRVGATPSMVKDLTEAGHKVLIETKAGHAIGFTDEMYENAGAKIVKSAAEVWDCEMVVKVKEPQAKEYPLLKEGQILFTFLHLSPDPEQTKALLDHKVIGIAYETVKDQEGRLPLLTPMSEVAGRIAIQVGASYLQINNGGKGILLGGVAGVLPAKVVVLGGGACGTEALRMALGLGAEVVVIDKSLPRLRYLDALFGPRLKTLYSTQEAIEQEVTTADLIVGAVLVPGKLAPRLVTKKMLKKMTPGSVIVDVAIDQGGCIETSRPTTHSDPIYVVDDIVHYCVTNMPGACARTATQALTNATMGYVLKIANMGYEKALKEDPGLMQGLNVHLGKVTYSEVAKDLSYAYYDPKDLF